jgi:hypothetical protein
MTTWNGSALVTRFSQKFGLQDTNSLARVLEWINEIQEDIANAAEWPFLKFKLKKYIAAGEQEISLAPEIPAAPVLSLVTNDGSLSDGTIQVKVTFVIFGEDSREFSSIESEPSAASNTVTITSPNSKVSVTLPTMSGSSSVKPTNIWRRVYVSRSGGAYYLHTEVQDNSATTVSLSADVSSVIEPPEYAMLIGLAGEDPFNEGNEQVLCPANLQEILEYDPGLSSTGTPNYYARVGKKKIMIYPKPSAAFTLSYWVYRIPQRIFSNTTRAIQLEPVLKTLLDAGVTWKGYEYKDSDGVESKLSNYETLKSSFSSSLGKTKGPDRSVRIVQ